MRSKYHNTKNVDDNAPTKFRFPVLFIVKNYQHVNHIKQVFQYLSWTHYKGNHSLLSQKNTKPDELVRLLNATKNGNRIFQG